MSKTIRDRVLPVLTPLHRGLNLNMIFELSIVNDFIYDNLTTVQYSKFDNVISIIQTLGEHVKIEIFISSQHIDFFSAILETFIYLVIK
jgi:hypothetical protein